jgi:hypothetical protein
MNVHQLSIAYVAEQDRILVRVNTLQGQELRFWFTRRLTLGLMPLLDRAVTDHVARQGGPATSHVAAMDDLSRKAVAQFQREETLKSSDFSTPFRTPPQPVALFDSPLLVTEINLTPLSNGQLRLGFAEKLTEGPAPRSFQMGLTDPLIHAFVHLLERALAQSQWRDAAAAATPERKDGPPGPERPAYLN